MEVMALLESGFKVDWAELGEAELM